uniref:Uncharacterized protein n=1 Tax=Cyclopterus lumpus TaxID=8103 RepID=A0A8C2ZE99_CYCLU
MEQCFRIALWGFFLIGHLQARPVCSEQGDMGFCYLQRDVKCENVMFTYPGDVHENCLDEVLRRFKAGLEHAATRCLDVEERIYDTLDALNNDFPSNTNSTACTLETKESEFKDFVENLESFVQLLNAKSAN